MVPENEFKLLISYNLENTLFVESHVHEFTHFDKIAYHIELLSAQYGYQYIWCSFDAFTNDISHITIPSSKFIYSSLNNTHVQSNILNIKQGFLKDCRLEANPYSCNLYDNNFINGFLKIVHNNVNLFYYVKNDVKSNVYIGDVVFKDIKYQVAKLHVYIRPTYSSILINYSNFMQLIYSIDIPLFKKKIEYTFNKIDLNIQCNPFRKIGYMLYLQSHFEHYEFIWIEMDAFTNDVNEITIPKVTALQKQLHNLYVTSNKLNFQNVHFKNGLIEYTPFNYKYNEVGYKRELNGEGNYGCFQIYGDNQLLLAYNNHKNIPDIGIGSNNMGFHDWTFSQNALNYKVKKLEIFTKNCKVCKFTNSAKNLKLLYYYKIQNNVRTLQNSFYNYDFNQVGIFLKLKEYTNETQWIFVCFDTNKCKTDDLLISPNENVEIEVKNVHVETNNGIYYYDSAYFISSRHDYDLNNIYNYGNYGTFKLLTENEVLFAYNNHNQIPDIGIGTCPNVFADWSFTGTGNLYKKIEIEIFTNKATYHPTIIILVSGQSNSQGWGGVYDKDNMDDQIDERILGWNSESNIWTIFDLENSVGTKPKNMQCFAFHFAKCYLKDHPNDIIGIIIHSLGGQSISRWIVESKNLIKSVDFSKIDDGEIYNQCVDIVKKCLYNSCLSKLHFILWHQGEGDYLETCEYYECRLYRVIQQFRNETFCTKTTPFIAGELLHNFDGWIYNKQNKALEKLNFNNDKFSRCAYTKYLECNYNDQLHFSTKSHRLMGSLYYDQYKFMRIFDKL